MRPTPNARSRRWCLTLGLLGLVAPLAAQDAPSPPVPAPAPAPAAPRPPRSQDREVTWPAPTAEDWARPCLIPWQRSWEDAQALSRETGKPILVCVNMDGEIASEHYAGVRYRQPEIAALYEQYVCVIASVYRHTPRDHDEQGRRILCPRFGSVTCGEHIALEGQAYQRYFDGQRVAPRHVGVELEGAAAGAPGAEMFDTYYAWDTESVFDAVRQGLANRVAPQRPPPPSDPSLPELLASPDVRRREQVEALWAQGDRDGRRALLEAALAQGGAAPLELLRLAVFSGDLELSALGRRALAQTTSPAAPDVIIESLDLPMPPGDQQALIDALARLGADSPRARSIAQARTGLAGPARVDVAGWSEALAAQGSYEAAAAAPAASRASRGRTRSWPRQTGRRTSSWPSRCSRWPRTSPTRSRRAGCTSTRRTPPARPSRWAPAARAATRCSRSPRSRWATPTRRGGGSTREWAAWPRCRAAAARWRCSSSSRSRGRRPSRRPCARTSAGRRSGWPTSTPPTTCSCAIPTAPTARRSCTTTS
jgi:hypothetical protein